MVLHQAITKLKLSDSRRFHTIWSLLGYNSGFKIKNNSNFWVRQWPKSFRNGYKCWMLHTQKNHLNPLRGGGVMCEADYVDPAEHGILWARKVQLVQFPWQKSLTWWLLLMREKSQIISARASYTASVQPEESLCSCYYTLPLSFRIHNTHWASA